MHVFEEVVVQGSTRVLHGFVSGWAAGLHMPLTEIGERVVFEKDWHIRSDAPVEKQRGARLTRLLVRNDILQPLVQALESHGENLHVVKRHRVHGAHFDFRYEICSRDEGHEVRTLFEALPQGVTMSEDYKPKEVSDASAKGLQMYAPVHDYVLCASGTARGHVPGILDLYRRARQHERIRIKKVELDPAT